MANTDDLDVGDDLPASKSRGILTVLWQRKPLVLLATLLGLLGGALFYWQRPPVYQSAGQIWIIKKTSTSVLPGGVLQVDDYVATHLQVLSSPILIDRAVKKKELASLKTFEDSGDPVGQILASLVVARANKEAGAANPIIILTYRGPVAEDCAKVLAAVMESYQDFLDLTYKNVSNETVELITNAREKVRKEKDDSWEKYRTFRQQSANLWKNKDGINLHVERVAGFEGRRSILLIRQAELRERVKMFEKAIDEGKEPESLRIYMRSEEAKATLAEKAVDDQLLPLLLKEKELLETYADDHPAVMSVRNRIALVRAHFEKGSGDDTIKADKQEKNPLKRHLNTMRGELRDNDVLLHTLAKVVDEFKVEAKDTSNYEFQEEELRKAYAQANELYDTLIKRLREIDLVRDSVGFKSQVLAQPTPGIRVAPSAFQIITGGLLLGILAGIGLAYLADMTDKSFRNPDEVRTRLGLPILGHIPLLKPDPEVTRKIEAGEFTGDPLLITLFKPKSVESEAYRAVRTALYFSTQGEGHRVIQVTSPNKGDGKSLMVGNLAISMARSGKKVLIIDADCRRPRQHKVFGMSNARGLTSVIADGCPWHDAVASTPVDGLSVLASGPVPHNPSELLSSPKFKELLDTVRADFDYVIVDTPPLLAVTDPCVVAGRVDGLVLVLRLSRQGRPHAERARQILVSLKVKILGVVVNGITRQIGTSIYSSDHYDYTDSYDRDEAAGKYDLEYYEDTESAATADETKPALVGGESKPSDPPSADNGSAG